MGDETAGHLRLAALPADPQRLFAAWRARAEAEPGVQYPAAMCLATVSPQGSPEARFVIVHPQADGSLVFLTDSDSPKARALAARPVAALAVYWDRPLELQIRIEGAVETAAAELTDAIFARRPGPSRAVPHVSRQSRETTLGRLVADLERFDREHRSDAGPARPEHWIGYRLIPRRYEFWQGRARRLHDRVVYTARPDDGWDRRRLAP